MTVENDIILIYIENKPVSFARIEAISPDHKPNWYHVKLLLLQLPLQVVTWILRDIYIDGAEFTMGGKRMRLEPVVCPEEPAESKVKEDEQEDSLKRLVKSKTGNVISLENLKKK